MPPPTYPRYGNPGTWGTAGKPYGKPPKPKKPRKPPKIVSQTVTPLAPAWRQSAEQEADSIIAELLSELGIARGSARAEAERTAEQERAKALALASALQALGIPGQIQGIYGNAAQSIGALASGFSGDVRDLAAAQGAEQANMVAGTGQEGAVRSEGAAMGDVLYGTQGFIPARGLEQMGAAFASEAALQPGFAMQFGQLAANRAIQDFVSNVLPEFTDKEAMIRTKRPSILRDVQDRRAAQREERRKESFQLYEAGFLTQRQLARRLGLKNWRKFPNVYPGSQGEFTFREVGGSLYAIDPRTGKTQKIIQGPGPDPEVRTTGGYIWERNPATGEWVPVGGTGPAPKQPPNLQHVEVAGKTYIFDPGQGLFFDPRTGRSVNPNRGGKPVSSSALKNGWKIVQRGKRGWWALNAAPNESLSPSELRQILKDAELPVGSLTRLSPEQLDELGVGYFYGDPGEIYLELVQAGIPQNRAKRMVRRMWPDWGTGLPAGSKEPGARDYPGKGQPSGNRENAAFVQEAGFTASGEVVDTIRQQARRHGLDELAVMAVALAEGGLVYGAVGDGGTSYGPFQLHVGGALPRNRDATWANSRAGLAYAIRKMAQAGARGLRGLAAIEAIVRYFERPADPDSEIRRAHGYYQRLLASLGAASA